MEIRAIITEDGEEYINAKDLVIALQRVYMPSVSALSFVRKFIINLITARRI